MLMLLVGAAAGDYAPSFFWSGRAVPGLAPAAEHLREMSPSDLERTVTGLVGGGGHGIQWGKPESKPDLHLVFKADGLDTEAVRNLGSRLPSLEKLMKNSAASLTVPFTAVDGTPIFARAKHVAGEQAVAYLKEHAAMLSDGKPDTLVVELKAAAGATPAERLAAYDALLGSVTAAAHAGTGGNYAALLTAARAIGPHTAHRKLATKPKGPYLHTGPTLLAAQLICLILLMIFLSGFCCLFSLQTPAKFEEVKAA